MKNNGPLYLGVFLTSLAVLALEVILNRMFALTFWYHFAFIILSIALFGISVGGLLVYFTNFLVKKFVPVVLAVCAIGLAFAIPLVLLGINAIPLEMNLVATSARQQELFKNFFLLLIIPFVLGGYIFSSLFENYSEQINKIYFFDLLGGGIGCCAVLLIFPGNGPMLTAFMIMVVVIIAAACFAAKQHWLLAIPVLLLLIVSWMVVYPQLRNVEIRVSKDKRNLAVLGKKVFSKWDNFGYVAIHQKAGGPQAVTVDYTCFTYLYPLKNIQEIGRYHQVFDSHLYPYLIKKAPDDIAIVGVGAGLDVLLALSEGVKNIYGAEFNSTVYQLYREKLRAFDRLPNVHVNFDEGRFFIRSSPRKYDVMIFDNAISQVAVSSGSFTLAESYLYTVEAMLDYLTHLKKDGVIYFSSPYIDGRRFVTVIREAFHQLGWDREFPKSIIVTDDPTTPYAYSRSYEKVKILVKNGAFTRAETAAVRQYIFSMKHRLLYSPYTYLNTLIERLIRTDDIEREYILSDTEIRPSTDDWPFFSQRVKAYSEDFSRGVQQVREFYVQPFIMLKQITSQVVLYCLLFLLLPLLFLNIKGLRKLPNKVGTLLYFSALGMGFMLMEVVMMQKYTLLLGHPVFVFAVVLASLLISSGIGSMVAKYIESPYRAIRLGLLGIIGSTIAAALIVGFFGTAIIGLSLVWRLIIIILLVAAAGLFMGFMMPSGIRVVREVENAIPWLWSINGIFSVLASFIAIYVSVLYGYNIVFALSIAVYTIGALLFVFKLTLRE